MARQRFVNRIKSFLSNCLREVDISPAADLLARRADRLRQRLECQMEELRELQYRRQIATDTRGLDEAYARGLLQLARLQLRHERITARCRRLLTLTFSS